MFVLIHESRKNYQRGIALRRAFWESGWDRRITTRYWTIFEMVWIKGVPTFWRRKRTRTRWRQCRRWLLISHSFTLFSETEHSLTKPLWGHSFQSKKNRISVVVIVVLNITICNSVVSDTFFDFQFLWGFSSTLRYFT